MAEGGGLKPGGVVLLVDIALVAEDGDDIVDMAVFVERVLVEIVVEDDAHPRQGRRDILEDILLGPGLEGFDLGMILEAVAMLVDQRLGDVDDILSLVAVLRKLTGQPEEFQVSCPGRFPQDPHLPAGIVEIVFAKDIVAGGFE